jgi:hypothetical protein
MLLTGLQRLMILLIGLFSYVASALATQIDPFGPPSDFLNSQLVIKTETGTSHLSIRLIEFLMGIQTDKSWKKRSDTIWILKTGFKDPVSETHKTYALEFEKVNNEVMLTAVSFDSRMFSHQEVRSFAEQIIRNWGKHISPK